MQQGLARISSIISGTRWGWYQLDEHNENLVFPFALSPDHSVIKEPAPVAATVEERPLSGVTLVPSDRSLSLRSTEHSDTSDMSLVVNIPSPEKAVTSAFPSRRGKPL